MARQDDPLGASRPPVWAATRRQQPMNTTQLVADGGQQRSTVAARRQSSSSGRRGLGRAGHPHSPAGASSKGSSHTPPRRPRAKTGQSSSWGYVWSSGPEASWGTWVSTSGCLRRRDSQVATPHSLATGRQRGSWVPDPGCLTQCTQGRAHVEDLTVLGSSLWLLEPIVASRTAARR